MGLNQVNIKMVFLRFNDSLTLGYKGGFNHINDIIYKNGKFLTFKNNGEIKSSIDTLRWKSMDRGTKFHLNGGSFGKGRFVVAENGEILSSLDGIGWTSNISGTSNILRGVTYKE